MAKAFPKSKFVGFDYHAASIEAARARARGRGRRRSRAASRSRRRTDYPGTYDLVACSTACTTWAIRSAPRGTSRVARRRRHLAARRAVRQRPRGGQPQPGRPRLLRRRRSSARRPRCRRRSASRSARRPARRGCATWSPRRVHAASAARPRRRSTSCSRRVREPRRSPRWRRRRPATRAREPDQTGFVAHGGVRVAYESFGQGEQTILCLPSWTLVNQRQWKAQVPYLARHCRVVTFDARGNGASDAPRSRPPTARARWPETRSPCSTFSASSGRRWWVTRSERAAGAHPRRRASGARDGRGLHRRRRPIRAQPRPAASTSAPSATSTRAGNASTGTTGGATSRASAEWFFGMMFPEPHSTRQIESGRRVGERDDRRAARRRPSVPRGWTRREARELARRVRCPVLVIHGADDAVSAVTPDGAELAAETGGRLVTMEGSGHSPERCATRCGSTCCCASSLLPPASRRAGGASSARPQRALLRLVADRPRTRAARSSRSRGSCDGCGPGLEIDWLAQPPGDGAARGRGRARPPRQRRARGRVRAHRVRGRRAQPARCSRRCGGWTRSCSRTSCSSTTSRSEGCYDLWIGDEAWEVDHFLHENPELKTRALRLADRLRGLPAAARGRRARGLPDRRLQRRDGRAGGALPARARPGDLRR